MPSKAAPVLDRWYAKVPELGPDVCWPFKAPPTNKGYCHFHLSGDPKRGDRIRILAHRFAWELHHKQPIPDGKVIDHICKNTVCVNPLHLRAVTQEANCMELARPTPFLRNKLAKECPHGHPYSPENTVYHQRPGKARANRICAVCYPHMRNSSYRVDPPTSVHRT
jgi:hypothetical protein